MQHDDPTTEHTESKASAPPLEQLAGADTDNDGEADFGEVMALLSSQNPQTPVEQIAGDAGDDETLRERLGDAVLRAQVAADIDTDGRLTAGDLLGWLRRR